MRQEMEGILSLHTNRDVELVRKDIERDKILTADDALEYGLIDQVTASRKVRAIAPVAPPAPDLPPVITPDTDLSEDS